jgi:two-component system, NtrC family, response regulator AtoC
MTHRILFVEDESLLRTIYQRQTQNQFEVDIVASAEEALVAVATNDYAVVITDMSMPGMDGLALAHAVRALNPRVVIMILTAHSSWPGELAPPAELVFKVLNKPCPRGELLANLDEALALYQRLQGGIDHESSTMA